MPDCAEEIQWPEATRTARPWTRWWWPGSAVDPENLSRSLRELREAGFGGVEVTPIYGNPGDAARFLDYLSPKWMEMFARCVREAADLDLGVDLPTGTGWPFGGPGVGPEDADAKLDLVHGRMVGKPSGFQVKRAAPGAEGPALNPFSPEAMRRYLRRFQEAFEGSRRPPPRGHFHDSFEYQSDWSPQVADAFRKLCGYALDTQAEALFGRGDSETVARVRADYRRTLAELHLQYLQTWTEWAHAQGSLTRNQAHGATGNLLDLYAAADVPETETFGATRFKIPGLRFDAELVRDIVPNPLVAQFASSAGHTQGKRLISCETCTWLREHFNASLAQMKLEIDQMFLAGINHIFYHGTCYSPSDAPWPGWLFYASEHINPRNSIWRDLPALNAYVTRCQSFLQSGEPDQDLLLYWPFEDLLHEAGAEIRRAFTVRSDQWLDGSPFGDLAARLAQRGYAADYVSDRQLIGLGVQEGRIQAPGGAYRAILAPPCRHIPVESMARLLDLAEQGAVVLFHRALPLDIPGFAAVAARRAQLKALRDRLRFAPRSSGLQEACCGQGRVVRGEDLDALMRTAGVKREPLVDEGLRFIRRRQAEGTDYFVANLGEKTFDRWIFLGRPLGGAMILDPLSGEGGVAAVRGEGERAQVRLQLQPGESRILRVRAGKWRGGRPWRILTPRGAPKPLLGVWEVEFIEGGPEIPSPFATERLASWTELGGVEAERFGGTARYRLEFDWQPENGVEEWRLDLGEVRESARVFLNGHGVGTAWAIPFELKVGPFLRPGRNTLEIEATNLCANRIRDMDRRGTPWKKFGDINIVSVHYRPLDASRWPVRASGLLGPVALVPLAQAKDDPLRGSTPFSRENSLRHPSRERIP